MTWEIERIVAGEWRPISRLHSGISRRTIYDTVEAAIKALVGLMSVHAAEELRLVQIDGNGEREVVG